MAEKTPDQIRRETVPVKHTGLIYGLLGGLLGSCLWFGGWAALHREQVSRYPEYCRHAFRANTESMSLFAAKPKSQSGMSPEQLRYALLRYGNVDHRYDAEIVRHGWYPKGASPQSWVWYYGGVNSLYNGADPISLFKWPFALTAFTFFAALTGGLVADYRYRASIITGLQFDGSIVATVDQYNKETKGEGMRYRVKPWADR